ncbi:SRPBCC family protein [Galbibacter mesophilus]|uniref:SRPBCC family protein n=1 Tax=Galbibacter mesophilus TaxID=379069 RepID=UPI00191FA0CA|nr:SRPBCC domain-containing protein [Galbibacter mesophilus]MCM5662741.1 SRPBCC domain-containing protein [Galbibacter mesophilus]
MKDQTIIQEITLNISAEKVWGALTDPDKMKDWYFDVQNYSLEQFNEFYFYEPNGTNFKHVCRILEIMPQKRIRYTWKYPDYSDGISVVSWQLSTVKKNVTHVKLTHSGVENFADAGSDLSRDNFVAGWKEIVNKALPAYLKKQMVG